MKMQDTEVKVDAGCQGVGSRLIKRPLQQAALK